MVLGSLYNYTLPVDGLLFKPTSIQCVSSYVKYYLAWTTLVLILDNIVAVLCFLPCSLVIKKKNIYNVVLCSIFVANVLLRDVFSATLYRVFRNVNCVIVLTAGYGMLTYFVFVWGEGWWGLGAIAGSF